MHVASPMHGDILVYSSMKSMQICEIFKMNQSVQLLNLGHGIFKKLWRKSWKVMEFSQLKSV